MPNYTQSASGSIRRYFGVLICAVLAFLAAPLGAAPFTPGNLVVYRVGTGVAGSLVNTGSAVFLDEYTPAGGLVQSIPLPTTANGAQRQLISSGTATSEGLLTRSVDGRYLLLTGYGADIPTTSLASTAGTTVPRVVGRVGADGVVDTSTALTDFASGNNPRSVVSTDGTTLWVTGGAGGIRSTTFGSTTSTQISTTVTNLRACLVFDDQLYVSTSSGSAVRIGTVGSGLPTAAGEVITNLPGFVTTGSPYSFFLADLNAGVAGVDTLYVAEDSTGGGQIQKYSLVGGVWTANGTVAAAAVRGLTGSVSGTTVTLYGATGASGAASSSFIYSFVDTSGYNAALTGTVSTLVTAAANTAIRGVAFAPVSASNVAPQITGQPQGQSIVSGTTATLNVQASGTPAPSFQWYRGLKGDTSNPVGGATSSSFTTAALTATTSYWVRATNSEGSADSETATVTVLQASTDLASLALSTGTLDPVFAASTTSYAVAVPSGTTSLTVTPTAVDTMATLTVNGATVASGAASDPINLNVGANVIQVIVSRATLTDKTYTVTVTRAASSNADLASLVPGTGALSPAFAAGTTSYVSFVPNSTTSITLTPTVADAAATVTVNGVTVASGAASAAINLTEGVNVLSVVVTAQNASTKTYTHRVVRQAAVTLAPGAIAFTGFNADGNDNLAFVALQALPKNTVIFFADEEWNGTDWAANTEACYAWVADADMPAGSVVALNDLSNIYSGAPAASVSSGALLPVPDASNNSGLGASDEAVFAFQSAGNLNAGGVPVPSAFLALIANEDEATAVTSLLGTGLSEAAGTAIIFTNDEDGMRYKGTRSGVATFAAFLPLLADKGANWDAELADGTLYLPFSQAPFYTVGTQLIVTEVLSNAVSAGTDDYWELTNVGDTPVAIGNWKWDDESANPLDAAAVTIPAGTTIAAGESIIFTPMTAAAFRAWWNLAPTVQVITGGPGLGQNDALNVFDSANAPVLSFSYGLNGFTRSNGSGSAGGHAGSSAGGTASQAAILDPTFGTLARRYTAATVGVFNAVASTISASDIGSPGTASLGAGPSISLALAATPATFSESATNPAATGTVTRTGPTAADLIVNLASNDTTEATVPATVTIVAGQSSATFNVTAVDDSFPDGNRVVTLTATAADSTPGTFNITVNDDGDVLGINVLLTEIQSNQSPGAPATAGDYWELTNFGAAAVNLAGYTWHDSGRSASAAAVYALPSGSTIEAGESVVFTTMAPAEFRTWWGLPGTVKVFQTTGAPGLGQNDGVSFFDNGGNEIFFVNYAAAGFTKEDGSPSTGGHAGPSAGGGADSVAMIWVPTSGTTTPRYTGATGSNFGSFQAAVGTDLGSPGRTNIPAGVNPVVSIAAAAVAEGNTGTTVLNLPVTRNDTTTAFTVDYAVTGGSATAGVDYATLAGGTLTFAAGGKAVENVTISITGDTTIEINETVVVTLSNVVNTTGSTVLGTTSAAGTITNDDFVPVTYPASGVLTSNVKGFVTLAGAEIPAYDAVSKRAFTSSGTGIQVVDLSDPAAPVFLSTITPATLGVPGLTSNDISSVSVRKGQGMNPSVLAAAIIASPKTNLGHVVFLNAATGALLGSVEVGPNPDHLAFTPDGTKVLVCNEGETAGNVAADTTPGSVSIIDVSGGFASPVETRAGFGAFDAQAAALGAAGVRIFQGGVPSLDFEPEYLAISPDGSKAMVTLQEANAVAVLDIATATFTSVVPLGKKDFSTLRTDVSDRDGAGASNLVNPVLGNPVFGLYMPDAIAAYQAGGQTYFVTANEGDDRNDFITPAETTTVGNAGYDLDDTAFPNEVDLKNQARLGRLTVSNAPGLRGDSNTDGDVDEILSYGARSFSILNSSGAIVFDSGDMIEMIMASQFLENYDDSRSDNKGPEPEGVTVATLGGRTYAFVGLERHHMVLVFDVTNPAAVTFTTGLRRPGDLNPEGMLVVPAADSPSGRDLLLVTNEVSNTLTIFELGAPSLLLTEVLSSQSATAPAGVGDYWELTNVGSAAASLAGYRWHDSGRSFAAGAAWALPAGSTIMPGESVIFTAADPAVFRTWWGLVNNVKIFRTVGVPGLGGNDGVSLFDPAGNELFFFSYAAGGFTRADGSPSTGGHAGPSAGGPADTVAAIWVPSSGSTSPRYTAATGANHGSFTAAVGTDVGSPGVSGLNLTVDLSTYVRVGRHDLPEPTRTTPPNAVSLLAQEASGVTYNWDTDTLFITADGGTSIVQVTKTGKLVDSMTLAPGSSPQGTDFYDPEGITYIGNGQFVMSEERDRQLVLFTYAAGATLSRSGAKTVKIGTFVPNTGTEGLSYDPLSGGFVCLKEIDPLGIFLTNVDFDAGTATNGSPTTVNSVNLFDPSLTGMLDFADVFAFSNLPNLNRQPDSPRLLLLSQESGNVINVDRSGNILSTLTLQSDPGNPLSVSAQQHEGITMDRAGNIYIVSENGGGDFDHPQLWVFAPSPVPNQAPTAIALANVVSALQENTATTVRLKVADIVITDDGLGNNLLAVGGADASFFEIVAGSLYIKAGTVLDFETKSSYAVTVSVDDVSLGLTPDASTNYSLTLTDQEIENPVLPSIIISEVAAFSSGSSPVGADWFEVTNTGTTAVDITGWKVDDSSASFGSALALTGVASIAPGESVIFIETADLPAARTAFLANWFGASPPAGLQIGAYTGSGIGLSTGGDGVNIYNSAGVLQAGVTFGASPGGPVFATFNNALGLNNTAISTLSSVGVNGAAAAVGNPAEIGSPGTVGRLFISEVAPWSSGNSPVGADWFEVTNSTAQTVDITGWKVDDSSESPAAALALNGITTIAPGESVIFIETATPATTATTFRSNWFGANPPAGLQIGSYTGGGIGLSTGGDAVNLYDASNVLRAKVFFGPAPTGPSFPTFDNTAGLNNAEITRLSMVAVNGAFVAASSASEIGSPGAATPVPANTVSIGSASVAEGNTGTTLLNLPVTRSSTATAFAVTYSVTGGTAASGVDFATLASGTLTFSEGGAAAQNIAIVVNSDVAIEADETILITLSDVVNTTGVTYLGNAQGTGTILNDDVVGVPYTQNTRDITTPNTGNWPVGGVTLNGVQFVNLGLQGVGRVPAASLDPATGESIGSISDMQISGWTKNGDGSYSGRFHFLPDRGYNSGAIFSNYAARINEFTFSFAPYTSAAPTAAQNQIVMNFAGSTRFVYDHDSNPATAPIYTTGLLANSTANLFGGPVPAVTGATTQSDGTFPNRMTFDTEGLILDKRPGHAGSGWVSDEYGPYVYHFNSAKEIDGWLRLPEAVVPHAPVGTTSFVETNVNGRRANQGMEGIAQSPDGRTLFALLQSATLQDSGAGNQGRANTRLMVYDVSASNTPVAPSAQYMIQLPRITSSGNGGAVDRTGAQSAIVAINDHQILILSRDGNGRGATGSPVFKSILLADLANATNIHGAFDAEGAGAAPGGVLSPSVTPLTWTEVLNLIGRLDGADAEVAKFGLNLNAAPGDINSISEKWEALELVPANDPANPDDFFLFVGNDNDFQSGAGKYMDANGNLQSYDAGLENDSVVLVYRVRVAAPSISVYAGADTTAPKVEDSQAVAVNFGSVPLPGSVDRSFTIQNSGVSMLSGVTVVVQGDDASSFSLITPPADSVASAATSTLLVRFTPVGTGVKNAVLRVTSNAPGALAQFDIPILGAGAPALPGLISFGEARYQVNQGATQVVLTINRTGGTSPVTVTVDTSNGTTSIVPPFTAAVSSGTPAADDYQDLAGAAALVSFGPGETTKTVVVTLYPKTGVVPNKRFTAALVLPTGGAVVGGLSSTTVEILSNDTTKPTVVITSPTTKVSAASPLMVTGTAGDARGLDRVEISLNGGPAVLANLGSAKAPTSVPYSLSVAPVVGNNSLVVTAYDMRGNSTSVTRGFAFTLRQLLTVGREVPVDVSATPDKAGLVAMVVTPGANSSPLAPATANVNPKTSSVVQGSTVKLTATAKTGYVFSHWSGLPTGGVAAGNVCTFGMPGGAATVTANFVVNPFVAPAGRGGVFYGLVRPDNGTTSSNTTEGYFTGTVTATSGALTGTLLIDGASQAVKGSFYGDGSFKFTVGTTSQPTLTFGGRTLSLSYNAAAGNDAITVVVTGAGGTQTSTGTARRAAYTTTSKVTANLLNSATKGFYTIGLPSKAQTPSLEARFYPQGDGIGTVNLTNAGVVTFAGTLADGTKFTTASALVPGNMAPVFVQLVTPGAASTVKGGSLGGELAFANLTDSDVTATDMRWFRPAVTPLTRPPAAVAATNLYTNGWPQGLRLDAVGALFSTTVNVQTALALGGQGNAMLIFEDGRLVSPIEVNNFTITGNIVKKTSATDSSYTLVLQNTLGMFTGTFTPNWPSAAVQKPAFQGIIIQKGANKGGYGFFISNAVGDVDPESGGVTLGAPAP